MSFGFTGRIASILQHLQSEYHKLQSFRFGDSSIEYFAGTDFSLEEFVDGIALDKAQAFVKAIDQRDEIFLGRAKRQWDNWFEKFDAEILRIKELFFSSTH